MAYDGVNTRSVYLCTGQPLPDDIKMIIECMLSEDFTTAYQSKSHDTHMIKGRERRERIIIIFLIPRDQ